MVLLAGTLHTRAGMVAVVLVLVCGAALLAPGLHGEWALGKKAGNAGD